VTGRDGKSVANSAAAAAETTQGTVEGDAATARSLLSFVYHIISYHIISYDII